MDYDSVPRDRLGGSMTPVIPKFYYEVDSQEQRIKIICWLIQELIDGLRANDELDATTIERVTALEKTFEEFKAHGFDDYYRAQIEQWFTDNAWTIYKLLAKQVYFGLTSDGYFCAYVPDSWREIMFDTGMVYGSEEYGRLILRFEADPNAQGVIDNTGYSRIDMVEQIRRMLNETNATVTKHEKTLYTNLDEEV